MFLGLLDPDLDPFVRDMDPAPDPDRSFIKQKQQEKLDTYCVVTSF